MSNTKKTTADSGDDVRNTLHGAETKHSNPTTDTQAQELQDVTQLHAVVAKPSVRAALHVFETLLVYKADRLLAAEPYNPISRGYPRRTYLELTTSALRHVVENAITFDGTAIVAAVKHVAAFRAEVGYPLSPHVMSDIHELTATALAVVQRTGLSEDRTLNISPTELVTYLESCL